MAESLSSQRKKKNRTALSARLHLPFAVVTRPDDDDDNDDDDDDGGVFSLN